MMNINLLRKSSCTNMFSASKAAFFAMEIINFIKDIIKMEGNYSFNKNIILGGIYNETHSFN
ncbi:hypothetical protein [Mycoplasma arginini]